MKEARNSFKMRSVEILFQDRKVFALKTQVGNYSEIFSCTNDLMCYSIGG